MMKKNLFVLLLALILPLSFVCAENYPYRSDVLCDKKGIVADDLGRCKLCDLI